MNTIRNILLSIMWPFGYLLSLIGKPEPRISYEDYAAIKKIIKPGDVLVSREDRRPTNWLIPGYWGHIAMYYKNHQVIDAIPPRVRTSHLAEWVLSVDSIAVLRPKFPINFQDHSNYYLGMNYNLGLFWARAWVCSMLVISWYRKDSIACPLKVRKTLGIETGAPQDIFEDRENFELLYERY